MSWHLVLTRDATVVVATEGAPESWIGARLEDCPDVPEDLAQAVDSLFSGASRSIVPVSTTVRLESTGETVSLTVIDALPVHRKPADIGALLRSSLASLIDQARAADVTLKIVVDPRMPSPVHVDGDKIAWAVTAIAGNALRYVRRGSMMMPSGTIIVRASFNSIGPEIVLEIQDDGPGIPTERLHALFATKPGPPLAVGLLMVRDVVAAHGGTLEVDSQTDTFMSGTVVRLTLPIW
jgi:signal transduction histidine kinase